MDEDDLDGRVRKVLRALGRLAVDPGRLAADDDLYDAGLKSLSAVQVLLGLEAEFGIEFPERMLHRGVFSTVGRLREAVAALVGEHGLAYPSSRR
jgi:acyl carrier protein